jgi:hypothetical protein
MGTLSGGERLVKCFYHPDQDAVGLCMACLRGVCRACAADLQRGLACKDHCEQEVRRQLDMRDFSRAQPSVQKALLAKQHIGFLKVGLSGIVLGGVMITYGLIARGYESWLIVGGLIAASGATTLLHGARKRIRTDQFRLCARCGYNVTGNTSGKCPECGFTV